MKNRYLRLAGRVLITLVVVAAAAGVAWKLWDDNMNDPWTRDAHLRADVVGVTPDVSGLITEVLVHDNQTVRKGDVLFRIDRQRFAIALEQAVAVVQGRQAPLDQARKDLARREHLGDSIVTVQQREQSRAAVAGAEADYQQAVAARDLAQLNLDRSDVKASVNGTISNLSLRPGDYVSAGQAVMALVDGDSMRVEGYFEETKLGRIDIGAKVAIRLMGQPGTLTGRVESIAAGIEDRERAAGSLLANVNPTFTWVRLAQRIPVRIAIENVPANARLVAGLTATVVVDQGSNR
ncbi:MULTISPECIES: HlyD family secretion protein [unclassified Mesorhizobium]|uniref:efflux RND transporter periplasmic adaptor subunit n=1 Tax=unclassified Mesorhizobium TaxID=325217 RepID=UPI001128F8A4|nr:MULTISPECIES: HlyD family secretion protein [unclassified Mesorhizobium]MBZ9809551.1 HlyD family secretion protein [Mesorhizobium sp. ESP-6-2]TPM24175.1 HlyD family secretion protein [Mesorhizobium sp. B2-2-2]